MGEQLRAAPRDASSIARPDTRRRKRVHIAVNVCDIGLNYNTGERESYAEAACDPSGMTLDMSLSDRAESWPDHVRCRRPGCASRWPEPVAAALTEEKP